jgi:mxaA protein
MSHGAVFPRPAGEAPAARRRRRWRAALLVGGVSGLAVAAQAQTVTTTEPRAFGHAVGDVVTRRIHLDLPPGLRLDESSLPQVGGQGRALELRSVQREGPELVLAYQVFVSPPEVRTLELPPLALRIEGGSRPVDLRVDAWPLTVSPLSPAEASPRTGLGELRPDAPPPLIDTSAPRARLLWYAGLATVLLGYLAQVYIGLPWWTRRRRPFGQAWRALRQLPPQPDAAQWRAAWTQLHRAFNQTAGQALFEPGVPAFLSAHPRFEALRGELPQFFRRSRAVFFENGAAPADRRWLLDFCRRCRDAERGAA